MLGWPVIRSGDHTLILAPTGSGKTLAAFLAAIDHLMFAPAPAKERRCRVLYISPLKALAVDVERNLRAPLMGVSRFAERSGVEFHEPRVAIRTGDTPGRERAAFARSPSDILITTPESLFLLLTSQARAALRSMRWVIIDEIHAMVGTKRGAHLALSLERLQELVDAPFQRIGLSATQRPLDEVARFLGGFEHSEAAVAEWPRAALRPRTVQIVDAAGGKQLDLRVEVPVEDMARLGEVVELPSGHAAQGEVRTSIWPAIYPMVLNLIRSHHTTLIFVNSRRLAERLAAALNDVACEEIVQAHHGSIAREQRLVIEDALKTGRLPAMVATSTLELGIDMGAIDLVIQIGAPPSISSAIQRIGRAGHQIDAPSKGIILPKYRGDLLACAALTERMLAGAVEQMRYPRNPLDVLAQQIVAMVAVDDWTVTHLDRVIRRAAPFAEIPRTVLEQTLDMLSGRYPSDDFAELRPRLTWDRVNDVLRTREGSRSVAIANAGTIPDRGLYGVFLLGAERGRGRVGELDEEMVFETKVGDVFVLGASSWRVEEITHDRVLVSPAPGQPGRMPFWHGESAGRPLEFGRAIGALTRRLSELPAERATALLVEEHCLDAAAAQILLHYLADQAAATGALPDDRTIVVEANMDDMGDWRMCILSPFGGKVHAPWAMAIGATLREVRGLEVDILWTDDGIVVRFPESDAPPQVDLLLPDPEEVEGLVLRQLGSGSGSAHQAHFGGPPNALFASRFREAAARALLLPRKRPGQRAPLWQQRRRAADLLQVTSSYGSFPIVLEAFRECLRDVFDMPALVGLLREIESRHIRVVQASTHNPSPFAASLLFNYVANFVYEGDSPIAERRAQALLVDPAQLRELLGEAELRELLDPEALESIVPYLQHLTPERAVRHADSLHDLLLRLGDLSLAEVEARSAPAAEAPDWLARLTHERRALHIPIAGERRYIAIEDTGRYRDALGIPPPPGIPDAFLESVRDPVADLVARYLRTHGPVVATEIAVRLGTGAAPVLSALGRLRAAGRAIEGEFCPGGSGLEWCDTGVLRALRQKSLARLRHEVEPVDAAALGRLYVEWHGVAPRRRPSAPIDVIARLQDASLIASDLESAILPARIADYDHRDLDALMAAGEVIWVGCEPLGQHDGRISFYLAENASILIDPGQQARGDQPSGPLHEAIREHLRQRGASFYPQIQQACGGAFPHDVLAALWDLVWAGEVTNDTLRPVREFQRTERGHSRTDQRRTALRRPTPLRASGGASHGRPIPNEAAGRWSLVSQYLFDLPTPTERTTARVYQILERFGLVTREAVQACGIEGGFAAVYGVLRAMEDAGRVRRGYFVAGLGAAQFALPGAVDRLRALRDAEEEPTVVTLAAADPANPYGAALPWPDRDADSRRPARSAGARVILVDGALAAWLTRDAQQVVTYLDSVSERGPEEVATLIAQALAEPVAAGRRRAALVDEVDGLQPHESRLAAALRDAGFARTSAGFVKRR